MYPRTVPGPVSYDAGDNLALKLHRLNDSGLICLVASRRFCLFAISESSKLAETSMENPSTASAERHRGRVHRRVPDEVRLQERRVSVSLLIVLPAIPSSTLRKVREAWKFSIYGIRDS